MGQHISKSNSAEKSDYRSPSGRELPYSKNRRQKLIPDRNSLSTQPYKPPASYGKSRRSTWRKETAIKPEDVVSIPSSYNDAVRALYQFGKELSRPAASPRYLPSRTNTVVIVEEFSFTESNFSDNEEPRFPDDDFPVFFNDLEPTADDSDWWDLFPAVEDEEEQMSEVTDVTNDSNGHLSDQSSNALDIHEATEAVPSEASSSFHEEARYTLSPILNVVSVQPLVLATSSKLVPPSPSLTSESEADSSDENLEDYPSDAEAYTRQIIDYYLFKASTSIAVVRGPECRTRNDIILNLQLSVKGKGVAAGRVPAFFNIDELFEVSRAERACDLGIQYLRKTAEAANLSQLLKKLSLRFIRLKVI